MKQNAVKKQSRLYSYFISASLKTFFSKTVNTLLLAAFVFPLSVSLGVSPSFAGVPMPDIPKALKGESCVEDTDFMRRNHMEVLLHQRDKTMREGVRTKKHSLTGCLSCHAVKDVDGSFVTIKSEKHFCNSCHTYAAVKIDCFGCHASVPQQTPSLSHGLRNQ